MNIPAVKSELALFQPRVVQTCIEKGHWIDYHPISSSYESGTTMEFMISESDKYLDLNDTMLVLNVKVKKSKGIIVTENYTLDKYDWDSSRTIFLTVGNKIGSIEKQEVKQLLKL